MMTAWYGLVTVSFRPRHKSDLGKPYRHKTAKTMTIGVQRFAVLLAVDHDTTGRGCATGGRPQHVRDDGKLGGLGHCYPWQEHPYCLVVRPVLPSYMR